MDSSQEEKSKGWSVSAETALSGAAIVFAFLISGAWLNQQFPEPYNQWLLGWVEAALILFLAAMGVSAIERGLAAKMPVTWMLGGVAVIAGIIADTTFATLFFEDKHESGLAFLMGVIPSATAVLATAIGKAYQAANEKATDMKVQATRQHELSLQQSHLDQQAALELKKEEMRLAVERDMAMARLHSEEKLERLKVRAEREARHTEVVITPVPPPQLASPLHEASLSTQEVREVLRDISQRFGTTFTTRDALSASPFAQTKTYAMLREAKDGGLIESTGHGKYRVKEGIVS